MAFQLKNSNYIFHFLLIYSIILLYYSISKNRKLDKSSSSSASTLTKYESQIIITFRNNGESFFLSQDYSGIRPSSIIVDSPSTCNIETFLCDIKGNKNNITLVFNESNIVNSCEKMFKDLSNITKIDLSNFDSSQVTNMAYMFSGCSNLETINFENLNTSKVKNMEFFLDSCQKLESVDVSSFDTSSVTNMRYMFSSLLSLKFLALSNNFNTSEVEDMSGMFYKDWNVTFLDLSMLNTSKVKNMSYMFFDIKKIKCLNISNFDTSNVTTLNNMFIFNELQYLDISQFTFENIKEIFYPHIFRNDFFKICINDKESIEIINSYYYFNKKDINIICSDTCMIESNIYIDKSNNKCVETCDQNLYKYGIFCFKDCPEVLTIKNDSNHECIPYKCNDDYEICKENAPEGYYFDIRSREYKNCFENCKYCYGPGNKNNNNCKECKSGFKLFNDTEYIRNCYEICPSYYYFNQSNNNKYTCTEKCTDKYNKIILSTKRCIDNCKKVDNFLVEFNGICMNKCPTGTIYNEENQICEYNNNKDEKLDSNDIMTLSFQESIIDGSFDNIISDIIKDEKDYTIFDDKIMYQITTSDNQKIIKNNISTVDIGNCERILKEKYGISIETPLIIFKRDYYNNETLIPLIEYEVYHPYNKSKLDLSFCNNTISLSIPVQINEDKLYQYNPNSDYYKDECSSYSTDNGTDILVYDRKKEYSDNKLSLCEANCYYQGYDSNNKQSLCDCQIKKKIENISDISNNPNVLSQDFNITENDLGYTNIFICSKNLFTINGILLNMSSYILLFSLLYFAATSFFFKRRGYRILMNHINNIINGEMKSYRHHKKHKKDSDKMNKYKIKGLNNKIINFPPKKSDNIFSIDNNNSNDIKIKKNKLKRNKSKKDAPIKILDDSTKKRIKSVDNSIKKNIPDF